MLTARFLVDRQVHTLLLYMKQKHLGLQDRRGRTALHLSAWNYDENLGSEEIANVSKWSRVEVASLLLEAMT